MPRRTTAYLLYVEIAQLLVAGIMPHEYIRPMQPAKVCMQIY